MDFAFLYHFFVNWTRRETTFPTCSCTVWVVVIAIAIVVVFVVAICFVIVYVDAIVFVVAIVVVFIVAIDIVAVFVIQHADVRLPVVNVVINTGFAFGVSHFSLADAEGSNCLEGQLFNDDHSSTTLKRVKNVRMIFIRVFSVAVQDTFPFSQLYRVK